MALTRVFPDGAVLTAQEAFDGWDPGAGAPAERPAVALNMVASVDGRTALDGASAGLSVPADREVFHALRGRVDAVLAGTGTLRAERYGRLVKDAGRRAAREARGLAADPLAVVLSRSGDVPDVPLLADPAQPSVVLTGEDAAPDAALARLRAQHGVRSLLCEGGPTLNRGLLDAGVVDELFVTLSPLLAGGEPPSPLLAGARIDPPTRLELTWALEAQSAFFLRYRVVRGSAA
ncbi:MAG: dihydrofolate reductase family protein [Solirubrobacteraceae bacterium MAG38_C4-C5]|nr:dihydrofolate reductase family protein [Candidatus Siliceabacter maunaloa]